ncbi:MAG: Gfo/Idh/MocA family oxidoreductase [Deltaproteobacteria bacterium]|nr:Gfo/Idh/MocA family oxidoreductase [Deltaproteobacteria bacterium]MCL4874107.1 Gfo/Idh/MocA family oxidoreductase [bacterium]
MISRKRIKAAVIGVGYLGRFHAQKYAALEDAELVGVVDADPLRAEAVAKEVGTKAFRNYGELLGLVDAVSIATPTEFHHFIGMEFLSRGVHVMMEKPLAADSREAAELVREAERAGVVLQAGHIERFNGAMLALGGAIKDPLYIEAVRTSPYPNRSTDVDVILDVMIHDIDLVLSLAGSEPEHVEATALPVVSRGKADFASARVAFRNGCVAAITASRAARERVRKITVYQPGAIITIDYAAQALYIDRTVPGSGPVATQAAEDVKVEKKDSLLEEIRSFIISVRDGVPPVVSGMDGMRALELAESIREASGSSSVCPGRS